MHRKAVLRLGGAAVAGLVCALSAGRAHAQNRVVFNQPFENDGLPDIPYTYAYQSNGSVVSQGNGLGPYGADGTQGEYMISNSGGVTNATDQNGADLGYRYWGMGLGNFILTNQQPTGTNQSDYVWSADVRGAGMDSNPNVRFRVQFQGPDTNGDGNGEPIVELRSPDFRLTNGYVHYSSNLSSWFPESGSPGSWSDFQNALAGGTQIIGASVFMAMDDGGTFGYGPNKEMEYDNLRLEQIVPVPEPAGLTVLGAAGLIALGGRRQRS